MHFEGDRRLQILASLPFSVRKVRREGAKLDLGLLCQVPTSAANFVELEALRWENRKLSDAKAVAETEVRAHPFMPAMEADK